jgi:transposase
LVPQGQVLEQESAARLEGCTQTPQHGKNHAKHDPGSLAQLNDRSTNSVGDKVFAIHRDRIDAPFLIEGSANMEVFAAYVGTILCPELHEGDVVILDNLCIHKTPTVARLIEAKGAAVRYLPAYSPDLNPIEQAFAKLKSHLRQAAARTLHDLQAAIVTSLAQFEPDHCQGFFRHARYGTI